MFTAIQHIFSDAIGSSPSLSFNHRLTDYSEITAISYDGSIMYYVSVSGAALMKSTDYGATWNYTSMLDYANEIRAISCSDDGQNIVVVKNPGSVFLSIDAGTSFSDINPEGSDKNWTNVVISGDGQSIAVNWAFYPYIPNSRFWTTSDKGVTWHDRGSKGSIPLHKMAISDDGTVIKFADTDGDIYESTDSGASFTFIIASGVTFVRSDTTGAVLIYGEALYPSNPPYPSDSFYKRSSFGGGFSILGQFGHLSHDSFPAHCDISSDASTILVVPSADTTDWLSEVWFSTDSGVSFSQDTSLDAMDSYYSISLSGNGLHAIIAGNSIWTY
jgi:hypothetical protein